MPRQLPLKDVAHQRDLAHGLAPLRMVEFVFVERAGRYRNATRWGRTRSDAACTDQVIFDHAVDVVQVR